MGKPLSEARTFISARVIATGNLGEARGLAAFPTSNPIYSSFISVIADIEAVACGADIGAYIAV